MRDHKVSYHRALLLHPSVRQEAIKGIEACEALLGPKAAVRIVQGLRTFPEQDALYAQGRTTPGPIVTNAKGGASLHNYGLAFDFALLYDRDNNGSYEQLSWSLTEDIDADKKKDWLEVVEFFETLGWGWGGRWKTKDNPHLEKGFGMTWREMLDKYNKGDFIKGTKYLNMSTTH